MSTADLEQSLIANVELYKSHDPEKKERKRAAIIEGDISIYGDICVYINGRLVRNTVKGGEFQKPKSPTDAAGRL